MDYVNAYEVTRHYGGPEEGGWWYDIGTPIASIMCYDDQGVEAAEALLHKLYDEEYGKRRSRFSVIGEEDLVISVEEEPAKPWPEERPHYE